MALTDTSTGTTMLVQPACNGYGYGNFGGGLFGGNNDIISILFIIALCNGTGDLAVVSVVAHRE